MPSKKNSETSDSNTEIFCQLVRRGRVERKDHHDFKHLYWELAGCFAMIVYPVLCLALAVSRYFMETDQKIQCWLAYRNVSSLLKMQEAGFVIHCKSQWPVPSTNLVCESLGTRYSIFQNTPLYVFTSATRWLFIMQKNIGFPHTHIFNFLVWVSQSVICSSEKQFLISLLCFISIHT